MVRMVGVFVEIVMPASSMFIRGDGSTPGHEWILSAAEAKGRPR